MAETMLEGSAVSAFCGGIAVMIAAGIQTDEAVYMLADEHGESLFKTTCQTVYQNVAEGGLLSDAMEKAGTFPDYALAMIRAGENSGRLEQVLRRLDTYYDEEERTFAKLRSSISYPAALLALMSVILAFSVSTILPVFIEVYQSLAGTLTSGSFSSVGISIGIGWAALIITLVFTVLVTALSLLSRSESGRGRVMAFFEKFPLTKAAMYQLGLSRFTAALSTYVSSGVNTESAMKSSSAFVTNDDLKAKVNAAYESMIDPANPRSLAQAIAENDVFEPIYARMLTVGVETGSSDEMLSRLSTIFFEDALTQIDRIIDRVEPLFAAFLTITVGATLIAVMLPLIGIMGSIG